MDGALVRLMCAFLALLPGDVAIQLIPGIYRRDKKHAIKIARKEGSPGIRVWSRGQEKEVELASNEPDVFSVTQHGEKRPTKFKILTENSIQERGSGGYVWTATSKSINNEVLPELDTGTNTTFPVAPMVTLLDSMYSVCATTYDKDKIIPKNPNLLSSVSVVISYCNRPFSMRLLVMSLQRQMLVENLEIVVVDSGSSTPAQDVLRGLDVDVFINRKSDGNYHRVRGLNEGVRLAKHEIVILLDDDVIPASEFWAFAGVEALQRNSSISFVRMPFFNFQDFGNGFGLANDLSNLDIFRERLAMVNATSAFTPNSSHDFSTYNFAMWKSSWMKYGEIGWQFDGKYGFEDVEFILDRPKTKAHLRWAKIGISSVYGCAFHVGVTFSKREMNQRYEPEIERSAFNALLNVSATRQRDLVPKIIHRFEVKGNDSRAQQASRSSWTSKHGEFSVKSWTLEDLDLLLSQKYSSLRTAYQGYTTLSNRLEFAVPLLLFEFGGVYVDPSLFCVKRFFESIPRGLVSFSESSDSAQRVLQNSLIASPPRHPFWQHVVQKMLDRFYLAASVNQSNIYALSHLTGSILLEDVVNKVSREGELEMVHWLPRESFSPATSACRVSQNGDGFVAKCSKPSIAVFINQLY